ncbi:MAG: DUF924 domain-containing protein [Coxiellaceae bacterium]|nr:DUF924 domain-containing protein [Coxiellaceae bacterium]
MDRIDDILKFWFGEITPSDLPQSDKIAAWWSQDKATDILIKQQFYDDLQQAMEGYYDAWLADAKGRLAMNLLINQFCRHIYRGCPEAYQYDTLATQNVLDALKRGMDQELCPIHRAYLYMPLGHSEHIEYHDLGVTLYEQLIAEADEKLASILNVFLQYAKARRDIIARFGRFPHRNPILNRESTPDEQQYLKQNFSQSN